MILHVAALLLLLEGACGLHWLKISHSPPTSSVSIFSDLVQATLITARDLGDSNSEEINYGDQLTHSLTYLLIYHFLDDKSVLLEPAFYHYQVAERWDLMYPNHWQHAWGTNTPGGTPVHTPKPSPTANITITNIIPQFSTTETGNEGSGSETGSSGSSSGSGGSGSSSGTGSTGSSSGASTSSSSEGPVLTITEIIPQFISTGLSKTRPTPSAGTDTLTIKSISGIEYGKRVRKLEVVGYAEMDSHDNIVNSIFLDINSLYLLRQILQGAIFDDRLIVYCRAGNAADRIRLQLSDETTVNLTADEYIDQRHTVARVMCHTLFRLSKGLPPTRTMASQYHQAIGSFQ